jgi:xanthine dehydrogenase molybdenum-binding subunit
MMSTAASGLKNLELESIGKRVPRRDALAKVTGEATYTPDVYLPGMLYAKVLRSPHPHARIRSIDTSKAEALPGVRAVLTHKNTIDTLYNHSAALMEINYGATLVADQRILDSVVRFVGDEVAAVAADTIAIAQEALELIEVDYEVLPFYLDPLEAEKPDTAAIHADKPELQSAHNVSGWPAELDKGDVEAGFKEADEIVEVNFKIAAVKQQQMETHGAVAQIKEGNLIVQSSTQNVQIVRGHLAHIFKMPMSRVQVSNPPYVGGGFGIRIGLSGKAEVIASALALATNKPVKYIYTRHEDLIASDSRHGGYVWVKLGGKKDGTLTAIDMKAVLNKGAYCSHGIGIYATTGVFNLALHRCPNLRYQGYAVYTNTAPGGAMRGYGNPQGNMAVNRAVDIFAERIGMDPLELRLKTAVRAGDEYTLPYPNDSSSLHECMELGAQKIGWEKRDPSGIKDGTLRRGFGMAIGTHWSGGYPMVVDYENAVITFLADGTFNVMTPATDIGTGCSTTLVQIAADALKVPMEYVELTYAETQATPYGYGSHSSRSVYMHGNAIVAAAEDVRRQILERAAAIADVNVETLELADGVVRSVDGSRCFSNDLYKTQIFPAHPATPLDDGDAQSSITLAELSYYIHCIDQVQIVGHGRFDHANSPPWYAVFADVTVDTETGKVTVNKTVDAHDVGRVINPDCVEGQIFGGNLQGVGYALTEELTYNPRTGEQYVNDMQQYMQPTASDHPPLEAYVVEEDCPKGPFGAKGLGETPNISAPGAVINAVYNALGISDEHVEVPLTPERVLNLIKKQA